MILAVGGKSALYYLSPTIAETRGFFKDAGLWAAKGGLKPTDIVAIGVGAGASVVAAIEKGEVDGVSQSDPALTILEEKKLIKIMVDTRTM